MLTETKFMWIDKGSATLKTVISMMQVNIQHIFDERKANSDHFNDIKTLILGIIPRILNIYQVKKAGGASIREGASIRINTVLSFFNLVARRAVHIQWQ